MAFKTIISRLSWRQVLIHFVAIWLFSLSFQAFSYLHDTKLLGELIFAKQNNIDVKTIMEGKSGEELTDIIYYSTIGSIAGLLVGFTISLIISIKRKWPWLNSVLALLSIFILGRLGISESYFLRAIFLFPGIILKSITLTVIINASILLLFGCLLFFVSNLNKSIELNKASIV